MKENPGKYEREGRNWIMKKGKEINIKKWMWKRQEKMKATKKRKRNSVMKEINKKAIQNERLDR